VSDCERDEFDIIPGSLAANVFKVIDSYMVFDPAMSHEEIYDMITDDGSFIDRNKVEILEIIKFWRECR
jgi:hypothetical protein